MEYEIEVGRYNIGERSAMPFWLERDQAKVADMIKKAKEIAQQQGSF